MKQPFFMGGIDDVEVAKALGAAGTIFCAFIVSTMYMIHGAKREAEENNLDNVQVGKEVVTGKYLPGKYRPGKYLPGKHHCFEMLTTPSMQTCRKPLKVAFLNTINRCIMSNAAGIDC
jgi:hypothetical protein